MSSPCKVYRDADYVQVVEECAKQSMANVAQEVKGLPHYPSVGEVVV